MSLEEQLEKKPEWKILSRSRQRLVLAKMHLVLELNDILSDALYDDDKQLLIDLRTDPDVVQFKELLDAEDKILEEEYYVRTSGFIGNSWIWWRKNSAGYTADLRMAQKYTKEQAQGICIQAEDARAYLCTEIMNKEHLQTHVESQLCNVKPVVWDEV